MDTEPPIRIGFVGVGTMGQCAHLKNYATLPECEVVAIAEVRPELGKRVAERYGVPHIYPNHEAMLAEEKLDGIVASQGFDHHGVLIPELLQQKLPVFTEKPLAGSIDVGEKILAAANEAGIWQMVGYHKRCDPATIYAKKEIDRLKTSGELGPMRYVRILMPAGDWIAGGFTDLITTTEPMPPMDTDPPAPDMDPKTFEEYTVFVNYYIHQVNLLRHLLGEPYRVTYAEPSGVLLAAESQSGVAAVIELSPYNTTVDWQEEALVAFEHGYVKLRLPAPVASNRPGTVEILRDPGDSAIPLTTTPTFPWVHAMRQQAIRFLEAIRNGGGPPCGAGEALKDLKIAREYIRLRRGS